MGIYGRHSTDKNIKRTNRQFADAGKHSPANIENPLFGRNKEIGNRNSNIGIE